MQGGFGVAATEAGDEAVFVGLDGALCGIGAMKMWRNELELYSGIVQK